MNDHFIESRKALTYAREALKNGEKEEARRWAERAAQLMPQSEDPWLILTNVSDPSESVKYARKALETDPDSQRAQKALEWASARSGDTQPSKVSSGNAKQAQTPTLPNEPQKNMSEPKGQARSASVKNPKAKSRILPILLIIMGCEVYMFAAWSAVTSPALASILSLASGPQGEPKSRLSFAKVDIAKPSSLDPAVEVVPPTATAIAVPTKIEPEVADVIPTKPAPTLEVFVLPTHTQIVEPSADASTSTPEVTSEPGVVVAEIVVDTPTSEYTAPTSAPNALPAVASNGGEHWIDVNLSEQRVYAYEGDTVVNSFVVSTGTWQTPTVTGSYKVWIKLRSTTMTGPGYYLPNVPFTMYFYKSYGLHGTYWHNNFGTPMSHGCVNLRTEDAEWLYDFSYVGTTVNVHY